MISSSRGKATWLPGSGAHVCDKDAVNAVMLACETAAHYAAQGMSLLDAVNGLYRSSVSTATQLESFYL